MPLSLALNAQFPEQQPEVWRELRTLVPRAPIIAHGLNNSTDLLPLNEGPDAQRTYIRRTIDMIEKIVREEEIDCDFKRVSGYLFAAPNQSMDILKKELDAAHHAGAASRCLA